MVQGKVVVIGGGMAGLTACASLRKFDKQVEITLVEPKDYVEIHWASYRALFDSDIADKCLKSINKWAIPHAVTHVRNSVKEIEQSEIVLADGQRLDYHVCVICTGATTRFPALGRGPPNPNAKGKGNGTKGRRLHLMDQAGKRLLNANSVLIVGGGLIGVEMAGELAFHAKHQQKELKITLVHSGEQLVPEFTKRAANMTKVKLEQMGVEVLLNETCRKQGDKVVLTTTKEEVLASEVVWTTGIYSCNNFLPKEYLDKKGWLMVDDYFRVKGAENRLFALGDCCDLLPNTGIQALSTMDVIGKNIKTAVDVVESGNYDGIEEKMRKALNATEVYVATIGKQQGVAMTPMCHTQFILPWIKNSTMFFFKPIKTLGLKD